MSLACVAFLSVRACALSPFLQCKPVHVEELIACLKEAHHWHAEHSSGVSPIKLSAPAVSAGATRAALQ